MKTHSVKIQLLVDANIIDLLYRQDILDFTYIIEQTFFGLQLICRNEASLVSKKCPIKASESHTSGHHLSHYLIYLLSHCATDKPCSLLRSIADSSLTKKDNTQLKQADLHITFNLDRAGAIDDVAISSMSSESGCVLHDFNGR